MSDPKSLCDRCGQEAETRDWGRSGPSTFWGFFGVATITTRYLRVKGQYFRPHAEHGSPLLLSDDTKPLCGDCWGDLIGLFLQGRAVPSLTERAALGVPEEAEQ